MTEVWHHSKTIAIAAPASVVWDVMRDTARWPDWNPGVRAIERQGAFEAGGAFVMVTPDGDRFDTRIVQADADLGFTDETIVDDVTIAVRHLITSDGSACRVTYVTEVRGPGAATIGEFVVADFGEVLKGLKRVGEARGRTT